MGENTASITARVRAALDRGRRFVTRDVWRIGRPGEPLPRGFVIKQVRAFILLGRGLLEETLLIRAAALTFATLLFLVPFLSLLFFFIQTFSLGNWAYDVMDAKLTEAVGVIRGAGVGLPEKAPEHPAAGNAENRDELLKEEIIGKLFPGFMQERGLDGRGRFENPVRMLVGLAEQSASHPGALGVAGLLFLFSTVFGFLRNIESAFNRIWGVRRARNPLRSLGDYLLVTLLLPFAVAGMLGVAALLESDYVGSMLGPLAWSLRGSQFAVVCMAFCLVYYLVPNTSVRFRYALLGGVVAGVLWVLLSWGFVKFQFGLARYALFFSTFALFPMLLMWIYFGWLTLLFGMLVTYAYQNEETFALERLASGASHAYREAVALLVCAETGRRFRAGAPPLSAHEAAARWNVPTRTVLEVMECLADAGVVVRCGGSGQAYTPGRGEWTATAREVVEALRNAGDDPSLLLRGTEYGAFLGRMHDSPELLDAELGALSGKIPGAEPSGDGPR